MNPELKNFYKSIRKTLKTNEKRLEKAQHKKGYPKGQSTTSGSSTSLVLGNASSNHKVTPHLAERLRSKTDTAPRAGEEGSSRTRTP